MFVMGRVCRFEDPGMRWPLPFVLLLIPMPTAVADDRPKPDLVIHTGHYEKNSSGLTGDASLLLFADGDGFERVFGAIPAAGVGGGRKTNAVTKATFEKRVVAAIVKRGNATTTYTEVAAAVDGDTLTVKYKTESGTPGTATFSSPLIISVPKGKEMRVVFVENGKEVGVAK
jgi:hypothetical protein